jgi:hypothetical protein
MVRVAVANHARIYEKGTDTPIPKVLAEVGEFSSDCFASMSKRNTEV